MKISNATPVPLCSDFLTSLVDATKQYLWGRPRDYFLTSLEDATPAQQTCSHRVCARRDSVNQTTF